MTGRPNSITAVRVAAVRLISRLGEVECRDCGWVRPAVPAAAGDAATTSEIVGRGTSDLAEEVAQALGRVLGKPTTRPRR